MSRVIRRSAINRAAEELQKEHLGTIIQNDVASFHNGSIAMDFAARLIYCKELNVIEIVNPFTEKQEIMAKIIGLMRRLEEKEVRENVERRKLF